MLLKLAALQAKTGDVKGAATTRKEIDVFGIDLTLTELFEFALLRLKWMMLKVLNRS